MHAALDGPEDGSFRTDEKMKRYDFTVPENAAGNKAVSLRLPDASCRFRPYALRRAFQKRDVKVDGHRVDLSAMASPGTQVCIYTDEARVKIGACCLSG